MILLIEDRCHSSSRVRRSWPLARLRGARGRSDHLDSSQVTMDESGTEVAKLWYYPCGGVRKSAQDSLTISFRFTRQRVEENLGLMYYQARYYGPALGRFVSSAPVAQADAKTPTPYLPPNLVTMSWRTNGLTLEWQQHILFPDEESLP